MLKKSFKGKMILPVAIIIAVLVAVLTVSTVYRFNSYNDGIFLDKLNQDVVSFQNELKDNERATYAAATQTSQNPTVVAAVKAQDRQAIIDIMTPLAETFNITYFTISDAAGNVLVRTYDPTNFGDSVANQQNVADAINGKINTYIESGTALKG